MGIDDEICTPLSMLQDWPIRETYHSTAMQVNVGDEGADKNEDYMAFAHGIREWVHRIIPFAH